jgi:hypothetical protein
MPPLAIWGVAAALEMAHVATGWTVIDEFCARFVYFYSGYLFALIRVRAVGSRAARPALALAGWRCGRSSTAAWSNIGFSEWPLVSLALGFAGAGAIIVIGTLLARARGSISCAIAASIPSSSISPSSCRWRRPGRCCSRPG